MTNIRQEFNAMRSWLQDQVAESSTRQVAKILDLDHVTVHRICTGETYDPKLSTMEKIQEEMER